MSNPNQSRSSSKFWRCEKCGTHNPVATYLTRCLGCGASRRTAATRTADAGSTVANGPEAGEVVNRPGRGRYVLGASWAYAAVVILVLILIRWVGEGWWGVTLLLLMPRWVFLVPVALLAIASGVRWCPWHWLLQGATALVVAGPLMGASHPLSMLWERPPAGERVRLMTFNLGTDPIRFGALKQWLDREKIDVICFQEGARDDGRFEAFLADGWHVSDQKFIATRFPIVSQYPALADDSVKRQYTAKLDRVKVRTPAGTEFLVASVHLPTNRPGIERFLNTFDSSILSVHTDWWAKEISRVLSALAETNELPILIGGDFNMPADDSTMAALRSTFRFAFEEAGWGYGYTRPSHHPWVRIDHILAGPEWFVTRCRVAPDFGSDHLPLTCEVVLPAPLPAIAPAAVVR
jgi:vancomycin resistance protein VanJ